MCSGIILIFRSVCFAFESNIINVLKSYRGVLLESSWEQSLQIQLGPVVISQLVALVR